MSEKRETKTPQERVGQLLARAASIASTAGIEADAFVSAAFQAFSQQRPEVAEAIAEAQFKSYVEALRRAGKLALA